MLTRQLRGRVSTQKRLYHLNLFKQAKTHARRTAIVNKEGKTYTYANLLNDSEYVSNKLKEKFKGGTVSFLCPSDYDYVVTQWAIWRAGCTAVPLCFSHPKSEMQYFVSNSESKILVASATEIGRAKPIAEELGLELLVLDPHQFPSAHGSTTYNDGNFGEEEYLEKSAMIIYTSGTTGPPKGVVLSHKNLETMVTTLCKEWAWSESDRILLLLPLHHIHGIVLTCCLWSGATCEMIPFNAESVWQRFIADPPLTLFMAVPTIYVKLIEAFKQLSAETQKLATKKAKAMRLMVSGSMALPEPIFQQWLTITGHRLLERYGMSEIGMALTNPLNPPSERLPGYIGKPFPSVIVKIKPEDEDPNFGELLVKGPQVFSSYYNLPEASKKAFDEEGWFLTGDVVRYDPERGIYKIEGRSSVDILKSGGYKISALDIEREILSYPGILEACVIGVPDDTWGQLICAIVVKEKSANVDEAALSSWLKEKLAHYKVPRKYVWVDSIPRNAMGKVNKKFLLKWWLENQPKKETAE